mmetsp:Transcript_5614/g.18928  ORF Transcript_5614/g.18928 Transcript_5614/m.18928 type:complete len:224 (-) Transcript_5614:87-758(-)
MTPRDDQNSPSRCAHARELVDKLLLIRHVLAALHRPHEIKRAVLKRHVQRVGDLIARFISQTLLTRQRIRPRRLNRRQSHAFGLTPILFRHEPRRAADTAPDVHDARHRIHARPLQTLCNHIHLRLRMIQTPTILSSITHGVIPMMHVRTIASALRRPHVFPQPARLVVKLCNPIIQRLRRRDERIYQGFYFPNRCLTRRPGDTFVALGPTARASFHRHVTMY